MPKPRKYGDHLTRGAIELRRYLDEKAISVPTFCESHGLDRIQVQRALLGERKRLSVDFAAAIDAATAGAIPMVWWTQRFAETAAP